MSSSTEPCSSSTLYKYKNLRTVSETASTIRLLTLLPGELGDNIEIRVHHTWLPYPEPVYEALSYVWGSTDGSRAITVDSDQQISVTKNLYTALQHLRYETHPRTLWIDAVCINQDNIDERNAQVRQMSRIYSAAARVIVWLGLEEDDSSFALDRLVECGRQIGVDWYGSHITTLPTQPLVSDMHQARFDRSLDALLSRPWFKRVWIRQEIVMADNAVIVCGRNHWPWIPFTSSILYLYREHMIFPSSVEEARSQEAIYNVFRLCRLACLGRQDVASRNTLLQPGLLRHQLRGVQASDPRDRIYGVWSLFGREFRDLGIPIDYNIPAAQLLCRISLRLLDQGCDLSLLLGECYLADEEPLGLSLPSWVPNYTTDLPWYQMSWGEEASSHTQADWQFVSLPVAPGASTKAAVRVLGRRHGSIQYVLQVGTTPIYKLQITSFLKAFWNLANKSQPFRQRYPTVASRLRAVCEMLTRREVAEFTSASHPGHYATPDSIERHCRLLEQCLFEADPMSASERDWDLLKRALQGRACFISSDGYVGFGPPTTRLGDCIGIILGCTSLYILRSTCPREPYFKLVGPCYVPELSYGECLLGPLPETYVPVVAWYSRSGLTRSRILFRNFADGYEVWWDPRLRKRLEDAGLHSISSQYVDELQGSGLFRTRQFIHHSWVQAAGVEVEPFVLR